MQAQVKITIGLVSIDSRIFLSLLLEFYLYLAKKFIILGHLSLFHTTYVFGCMHC